MFRRLPQRRGVTAVLAMLYLTLMASLALGFYSASNTAALVSFNEQKMERARLAAESGLDFARFQLMKVTVPGKVPKDQHFDYLGTKIFANMNGSENLNKGSIYADADIIRVPADPNAFIKSDGKGAEFQFVITEVGEDRVEVRAIGRYAQTVAAPTPRGVKMEFQLAQKKSSVLDFGIATRGHITMSGNASIRGVPDPTKGSILSTATSPGAILNTSGGVTISGDVSATNPNGTMSIGGNTSVGGTKDSAQMQEHIHKGVEEPEFPTIDTSIFRPYATNVYVPGQKVYSNVRVPPNTNPNFSGGTVFKGVLFIESPNKVHFSGQAIIQGVIAVDTDHPAGTLKTNSITFSGGSIAQGVESLDASYGDLRKLTGSFILAPGYEVTMSGGFGAIGGAIVADKLTMSGGTNATMGGSVIIMQDTPLTMSGGADITVGNATIGFPAGLNFSNRFMPLPGTYDEIKVK